MSKTKVKESGSSGRDLPETVHNNSQVETTTQSQAIASAELTTDVNTNTTDIAIATTDSIDGKLDAQPEVNVTGDESSCCSCIII